MLRRLLILESQVIIGLDVAERVRALGWQACGPYNTTADALEGVAAADPAAGLLDLSMHEESRAEPVAEALSRRGLPFIFTNSHGARFKAVHPAAPRLEKPFADADFLEAVALLETRNALRKAPHGSDSAPPAGGCRA